MPDLEDNRINSNPHKELDIELHKVPADSVPYGESISTRGDYVWAAYDDRGALVCVAATAKEVRRKYLQRKRVTVKNVADPL